MIVALVLYLGLSLLFLPSVEFLEDPAASLEITVWDWKRAEHPFQVGPKNADWTPLASIPGSLEKAVVASEDWNFYSHGGLDLSAIKDALLKDLRERRLAVGGSTITQQLAKNLFLSRERTLVRKLKEAVLARKLDKALSKGRILELYLNVAELGPMVYGVGHASRYYFGKPPSALTLRESAFLAAMLPGPRVYNPYRRMDRVMRRSDRILRVMWKGKMISAEDYEAAHAEVPNLSGMEAKVTEAMGPVTPEEEVLQGPEDPAEALTLPDPAATPDDVDQQPSIASSGDLPEAETDSAPGGSWNSGFRIPDSGN